MCGFNWLWKETISSWICVKQQGCGLWRHLFMKQLMNAWDIMKDMLLTCFAKVTPIKKERGKPCPWLTDEIKKALNNRDKFLRKFRKTKSDSDMLAYNNTDWKRAKLVPMPKARPYGCIKKCRPVLVIPGIFKLSYQHISITTIFYTIVNLAFVKHATLFVDNGNWKADEGKLVLTKAFDTPNHGNLENKLDSYGIFNEEYKWFQDYLFCRTQ